jgi:uncharacterized membrane protein
METASEKGLTRSGATRLDGIDLLRGFVIVLMVLDHARDFLHSQAFVFDPTDLSRTTPFLFATRWITHLCAPTFVFLAGVAIFLQRANGKDAASVTKFLLARGCWLIALELTVVSFGFDFGWPFLFIQVIWAIGASMLLMAALMRLTPATILAIGAAIVSGHELLAGIDAVHLGALSSILWRLTMEPGPTMGVPGLAVYPAIPWFGIMCLGYGLGYVFLREPAARRRGVLALSAGALALFALLRLSNLYGNPSPWSMQDTAAGTAMSFINVAKYPPSLDYVLVTLGVSLLMFCALDHLRGTARRVLLAFGRTPLFTYVAHIYVLHLLSMLIGVMGGIPARAYLNLLSDVPNHLGVGFDLWVAYLAWAATLALLYPLSSSYERFKARRRDWWLSYL